MNLFHKNQKPDNESHPFHLRGKRITNPSQDPSRKLQRGQILIIVVFAITGLVLFTGLVVDTGLVFIANGKLRRATDAAALAAAAQYRKDPYPPALKQDAVEFLVLNSITDAQAEVYVCNPGYPLQHEADLCTSPARRRLVKVVAHSTVPLAFFPVLGIRSFDLTATATSEAASLDIVMLMDVSESMTWDNVNTATAQSLNLMADPAECNNVTPSTSPTNCDPFHSIQDAAVAFVQDLFPADGSNQYDRVAVIPFDRLAHSSITGNYNDPLHLGVNSDYHLTSVQYRQTIINELNGLRVFDGSGSSATGGPLTDGSCLNASGILTYPGGNVPCRYYPPNGDGYCFSDQTGHENTPLSLVVTPDNPVANDASFADLSCFTPDPSGPYTSLAGQHYQRAYDLMTCPDPQHHPENCGTTNTGGAFLAAGQEFVLNPGFRQESLWIVIMLTDGIANHTNSPFYCPVGDGLKCQDTSVRTFNSGTRHCLTSGDSLYAGNPYLYPACIAGGGVVNTSAYDADDYARDMADFDALGQATLIYTIGFGTALNSQPPNGNPNSSGEQLLNYAADIGDDAKIDTPANQLNSDYFYAHTAADLAMIFQTISDRIATRLTH
jgi:hypothetical protein